MLSLQHIGEVCENLTLQYHREDTARAPLRGIADLSYPRDGHIFFVKDRKKLKGLLKDAPKVLEERKGLVLLLPHKLWGEEGGVEGAERRAVETFFEGVITSTHMEKSLTTLSQYFWDVHTRDYVMDVDGRQLGEVDIHPTARIAQNVFVGNKTEIAEDVVIYPGVVIQSNCKIGRGTVLYPGVSLYHDVEIGENCRVHSHVTLGADGFGYVCLEGIHFKYWHLGWVILGTGVEIGAQSAVDAGTFSPTRIGDGTKLDNFVQVGHNCEIGKGVIMCGHVAIGGSTKVGDYTVFGGKSATGDNLEIGPKCQVAGGALVNCSWGEGLVLGGASGQTAKRVAKGSGLCEKGISEEVIRNVDVGEVKFMLEHGEVLDFLPHRAPFLFIDRVKDLRIAGKTWDKETIVSLKELVGAESWCEFAVTTDMEVLRGHFPGNPLVPGVCQVEMMAQASCFLLCPGRDSSQEEGPIGAMLVKVQDAKFRKPVRPGDHLEIYAKSIKIRGSMIESSCSISSGGGVDVRSGLIGLI